MRRLKQEFEDELVIIGVHSAKFPSERLTENIRQAVMQLGIHHPVVNDAGFQIWNAYAVRAWPTLILIDPTGRIAGETAGEIQAEEMIPVIRQVIDRHREQINRTPVLSVSESDLSPERLLHFPGKLLVSGDRLFLSDSGHNRILQIRLDPEGYEGEIERIFGSGRPGLQDGDASSAQFHGPRGLALKGSPQTGTLYVADTENHAVRAIDLQAGTVRTVAGTGEKAHGRYTLRQPTQTPLRSPWDLLLVDEQYLLIAMAGSHQIWVLIDEEKLGPFAGNGREALVDGPLPEASFNQPSGLAFGLNHVFVADSEASAVRAIPLAADSKVMTLVGQGLFEFGDIDGQGAQARLQHAIGIAFAGDQVYLADTYNHKIKTLDPFTAQVKTLAGTGQAGHRDGPFDQAMFYGPEGLSARDGLLYVADTNNHEIRVLDLAEKSVHTLKLRSLVAVPPAGAFRMMDQTTEPVTVRPGQVEITLDLRLPPGYKRDAGMPATVQEIRDGDQPVLPFEADQEIAWTVEVAADDARTFEVTIYYCDSEEARLCKVDDRRITIPLQVADGGTDQVTIPYTISG